MTRSAVQLGSILVIVIFLIAWYLPQDKQPVYRATLDDVPAFRAEIEQSIASLGPTKAYAAFKTSYQQAKPSVRHTAAHLFGESLYSSQKLEGVRTCDAEMNFGCYHGFFTKAVTNEGLDVISLLDNECGATSRASACQHGIGHGILEYIGHTRLTEALAACAHTNQPNPLAGCTSGVFMEYNVPAVTDERGVASVEARPLIDPEDPYAPCFSIDPGVAASCFHELPQWWKQVYHGDFKRMSGFCARIPDLTDREACFSGIGKIVGSSTNYSVEDTKKLCATLGGREEESTCLLEAAGSFVADAGDYSGAALLCASVSPERQGSCLY